jgi:transposase
MSICDSGIGVKLFTQHILIEVPKIYQLIILANKLPWEKLYSLVEEDLIQSTLRKKAHYGRKLKSRIHLGIYLLQKLKDYTDREMEEALKDNAAYQVFCGLGIVDKFHCPDHTNIERFRSRLSPETQNKIANLLCKNAVELGLANTSDIDIDSTVQEANMTYPTDAKMLRKLGNIAVKVLEEVKTFIPSVAESMTIDIKAIATKARKCFFLNLITRQRLYTKDSFLIVKR